jgi:hypothetical protein
VAFLDRLNPSERRWVDFIRSNIVGRLEGGDADRAETAAIVTWWSLKEGILDLASPLRQNLCHAGGADHAIGDLATCPAGSAWQVGIAGIQPGAVTLAQVQAVASRLYPGISLVSLLDQIAVASGIQGAAVDQIRNSTGDLQKSWLLRDGPIAFTLQRPFVEKGCLGSSAASWCFGSWDSARRFASDAATVRGTIDELAGYFSGAPSAPTAPGGSSGTLAALAAVALLGGAAYALVRPRETSRLVGRLRRRLA